MLAWICCRCKISNHALLALIIIYLFFHVHVKEGMSFAICILIYEIICSQVLVLPPFQRMGLCAEMLQTFYNDAYRRKEVLDITGKDRQFMCCELYCRNHWIDLFCNFHSATCTTDVFITFFDFDFKKVIYCVTNLVYRVPVIFYSKLFILLISFCSLCYFSL